MVIGGTEQLWGACPSRGELPEDADLSWCGTVCWALWNASLKCPLQNLLEKEHARSFLLNRRVEKKKKRMKKKKALWLSAASRKKVLTPLPPPPPLQRAGSESQWPSQLLKDYPFRKHQSELWHWFVPLLHYLILCWMKPDYFSLPLPTSWLLSVQ